MYEIYLPIVAQQVEPTLAFLALLVAHPDQMRPVLAWDACLATAAQLRSKQIAETFAHCYQGDCVNRIVRRTCPLPASYPENGNSIESLVGGVALPEQALAALLRSKAHADHLLGRNPFFVKQNKIGIGFSRIVGSAYQYYYVVLIGG